MPAIPGEAGSDFLFATGADDQQDVICAFEWPAQEHEALGDQGVHEFGVLTPVNLAFQRLRSIKLRAMHETDGEDA
jgi:hypothetical protein